MQNTTAITASETSIRVSTSRENWTNSTRFDLWSPIAVRALIMRAYRRELTDEEMRLVEAVDVALAAGCSECLVSIPNLDGLPTQFGETVAERETKLKIYLGEE